MCWIDLLKHKDEAFDKFKVLKALVENELDKKKSNVSDLTKEENTY